MKWQKCNDDSIHIFPIAPSSNIEKIYAKNYFKKNHNFIHLTVVRIILNKQPLGYNRDLTLYLFYFFFGP